MSSSVETFTLIVLVVVSLPSLEGNHGDDHKSVQALDFQHLFSSAENQLKLSVERSKVMNLEGQLEHKIRRSQDDSFKKQLQRFSGKPDRMKTEFHNEMVKYEHLNKLLAYQKIKPKVQLLIYKEKGVETEGKEQLQYSEQVTKKPRLKAGIRVEMQEHSENNKNSRPVLWKRGNGKSAGTQKLDKSGPRLNDPQPRPPSPLRSKGNEALAVDMPSPAKHKNKLTQFVSDSFSKTKRLLSGSKGSRDSKTEDSGTGLSSGYMKKPVGLGKIDENAASRDSQVLNYRTASGAKQDESRDTTPPRSPEINQMWDFINRHSKQWSNPGDSPPPPNHHQQSPNRQGSPPKRRPQSPTKSESPKNKSVSSSRNAGPRAPNSKEDKDAHHLIKRHKKGWSTPEGLPADDASSSSPEQDSVTGNPPSRQSFPASHSTAPGGRGTPSPNSRKKVKQPSSKELDAQYEAYITRVRSRDGQEKK